MKSSFDKKENNTAIVTIEVEPQEFEEGLEVAYKKMKNHVSVPGFRKGKATRKMIEKMYGIEVFYEDAVNHCVPIAYEKFLDENKELDIASRPDIKVDDVNKDGFVFKAEVATKPPVKLGEYKGVEVAIRDIEVTDEEVEKAIQEELDKSARIIPLNDDESAKLGDTCIIDYEGFVDDVAFDGGKGEGHPLELGSHSFIPGFEDQLIGVKPGEDKDIIITFPSEYHSKELAGKEAVFKCHVNEIKRKEIPELDDELVQDISEFDNVSDYKEDMKKKVLDKKTVEYNRNKENLVMQVISDNAEVDMPDLMIDTQTDNLLDEHFNNISRYGLDPQKYMELTGMTMDKMREEMRDEAVKRSKLRLVLEEICKVEGIQASDDEVEDKIKELSKQYKMEVDKIKEMLKNDNFESVKQDIKMEKTINMLRNSAKTVEPSDDETEE